MSLANKLAVLQQKAVELQVKEVKIPENSADPLTLFEANSSARAATANEWIIDVFPNQIPIVAYLCKLASIASSAADHKDQSKSSLATFCMYYLTVFQAFFLLNDLHVRPSPSNHSFSWSTISWKQQFAEWLLSLPVPESMEKILSQLVATTTSRTKNVFFVPSAAGFNTRLWFGRFVPLSFFAEIHDCIATMPGNSRPIDIMKDLLPRVLATWSGDSINNKTKLVVADILGCSATTTHGEYPAHKWYQTFTTIFNPVLFRDFHRRSSLATLDMTPVKFTEIDDTNAYDMLFAANPHNLRELKVVLQHVAGILSSTVPVKKTLSQFISSASGNQILAHGYSTFALPTWISNYDSQIDLFANIVDHKAKSTIQRATDLNFLTVPGTRPAANTTVTAATAASSGTTDTASIDALHWPWSLISLGTATAPKPELTAFRKFNDDVDTYPKVLVLDVSGSLTVDAHLATLSGKTIESFELDGTTIEMPNVDKSLARQNCLFADSAIPYKYVVRATRFHLTANTSLPLVMNRFLHKNSSSLPAASHVHNRLAIMLPQLQKNGENGQSKIIDATAPINLPGLSGYAFTDWIRYSLSFVGFSTKINQQTDAADTIPAVDEGRFYVWSPYTYTSYDEASSDEITPDLSNNRTYYLTNLRSIFGTDFNLVELVHPLEAMPI